MAKVISDYGKRTLFNYGWRSNATKIRLYTSTGTMVDEKDITFVMDTVSGTMYLSTPVIFNVASGTPNVSQVKLFSFGAPDVYDLLYTEDLANTYNFTTAGTLTLDTYFFDISSSFIEVEGKNKLWNDGWVSNIAWAKLIKGTNTLVDTKTCSFEANVSTNSKLTLEAPIVFDVPADPSSVVYTVHLGYTDGTDKVLFKKNSGVKSYPTLGTYTVNTWEISV